LLRHHRAAQRPGGGHSGGRPGRRPSCLAGPGCLRRWDAFV